MLHLFNFNTLWDWFLLRFHIEKESPREGKGSPEPHKHAVPDGRNVKWVEVKVGIYKCSVGRVELLGAVVERVDSNGGKKAKSKEERRADEDECDRCRL